LKNTFPSSDGIHVLENYVYGSDLAICNAARVSYNRASATLEEKDKKLIKYLAEHSHLSPFEHAGASITIQCPIYIAAQIMRHRTFSYNMVSRRYTADDVAFYTPDIRAQAKDNKQASDGPHKSAEFWQQQFVALHTAAHQLYEDAIKDGVSREVARGILPQNLQTKFVMTGNLRNYTHFISLRTHPGAQAEVSLIAGAINDILLKHFPVAMEALANGKEG